MDFDLCLRRASFLPMAFNSRFFPCAQILEIFVGEFLFSRMCARTIGVTLMMGGNCVGFVEDHTMC